MSNDAEFIKLSYAFDDDLTASIPVRPKAIDEILLIPQGEGKLLCVGGASRVAITGAHAVSLAREVWPRLDGKHTIEELERLLPAMQGKLASAIALLHRYALIEEGAAPDSPDTSPLVQYIGRLANGAGFFSGRADSLDACRNSRLAVVCPASIMSELCRQLEPYGFGSVTISPTLDDASDHSHALFVLTDDAPPPTMPEAATGRPTLITTLSSRFLAIGPVIGDSTTPCVQCVRAGVEAFDPPDGERPSDPVALALIALHAFGLVSKTAPQPTPNSTTCLAYIDGEWLKRDLPQPRRPGCVRCGLGHVEPIDSVAWKWSCWEGLSASLLTSHAFLSHRTHEGHYKTSNIKLADAADDSVEGRRYDLPEPTFPAPSDGDRLTALSCALAAGFGFWMAPQGRKKVAPTGGGLRSPEAYLYLHEPDLPHAIYRYHAEEHCLVKLPKSPARISMLNAALGEKAGKSCLIATSRLGRLLPKYHKFSERIGLLDSGAAATFFKLALRGTSVRAELVGIEDLSALYDAIGVPHSLAATALCSVHLLPDADAGAPRDDGNRVSMGQEWNVFTAPEREKPPVDPQRLAQAFAARRAQRSYRLDEVSLMVAQTIMDESWAFLQEGRTRLGALIGLRALRRRSDGLYDMIERNAAATEQRSGLSLTPPLESCFNQRTIGRAPLLIFAIGDVPKSLAMGPNGVKSTLLQAGEALGFAWLAAEQHGLVGSFSGGALTEDLSRAMQIDAYSQLVLFSLALGMPGTQ